MNSVSPRETLRTWGEQMQWRSAAFPWTHDNADGPPAQRRCPWFGSGGLHTGAGVGRLGGDDPEGGNQRELMAKNVLTKKIAEEFLVDWVDLEDFTELDDDAAECLSKHEGDLDLNRLTSLSDAAAEGLSKHEGYRLYLNGLTSLSEAATESLSKYEGFLYLNGLTSLSDAAAESLSNHEGVLYLNGLASLSDAAADSLNKHKPRDLDLPEYHVKTTENGKLHGPFSSEQVKKLARKGKLRSEHLVSANGGASWRPASKCEWAFQHSDDSITGSDGNDVLSDDSITGSEKAEWLVLEKGKKKQGPFRLGELRDYVELPGVQIRHIRGHWVASGDLATEYPESLLAIQLLRWTRVSDRRKLLSRITDIAKGDGTILQWRVLITLLVTWNLIWWVIPPQFAFWCFFLIPGCFVVRWIVSVGVNRAVKTVLNPTLLVIALVLLLGFFVWWWVLTKVDAESDFGQALGMYLIMLLGAPVIAGAVIILGSLLNKWETYSREEDIRTGRITFRGPKVCTTCNHGCAKNAVTCPQCGYSF